MSTRSEISCPNCGTRKIETIPEDACLFFHECDNCKLMMKPLPGDCCVFCSYGSVPCPSSPSARGSKDPC
ncbi:MAG: GDCCVxC domain-containing (seleno)protein [Parvibaculum sp.]|uniref:GDCCVxC domain-containing (seleno)protein n=1 Tax=Parvibaculum sp. TaxID=2024848 RepID=UPI0027303601|nr:GDCCVxC domain-containing (seleno)protein [Parvibaculum sp.]MDP2150278.1 GDCCVxC domain-containing (seleno)protein [Parvibaculum sp.]